MEIFTVHPLTLFHEQGWHSPLASSSYSGCLHWNPANDTGYNILSSALTWLTEWLFPALSSACSPTAFPPFNRVFCLASPSMHMCLMVVTWVISWKEEALTHFIVKETEAPRELEGLLEIVCFKQERGGVLPLLFCVFLPLCPSWGDTIVWYMPHSKASIDFSPHIAFSIHRYKIMKYRNVYLLSIWMYVWGGHIFTSPLSPCLVHWGKNGGSLTPPLRHRDEEANMRPYLWEGRQE